MLELNGPTAPWRRSRIFGQYIFVVIGPCHQVHYLSQVDSYTRDTSVTSLCVACRNVLFPHWLITFFSIPFCRVSLISIWILLIMQSTSLSLSQIQSSLSSYIYIRLHKSYLYQESESRRSLLCIHYKRERERESGADFYKSYIYLVDLSTLISFFDFT